ncbi:MAG: VWA domain-containing protein [Desulfobulbaceae bacterium]|nr:VWA domain-containing protein [Desulfobulbaceae bacterium]
MISGNSIKAFIIGMAIWAFSGGYFGALAETPLLKVESSPSIAAVAPGTPVTVMVLVTIEAPALPSQKVRPPVAVSLVIDHSGSMAEAKKLDYARKAGKTLVRALEPRDRFGLVIYDDTVQELYPLSPVTNKEQIIKLIDRIKEGGYTFLSGGLEAGVKQARQSGNAGDVRRVILLSDGLANRGVTNPEMVAAIGAKARNAGIGVSTVGLGVDYDENLMQLLAERGGGQYYYVKDSEDLPAVFRQELALAAESVTRDLSAAYKPSGVVGKVTVFGYNTQEEKSSRKIDMSDMTAGEKRQIMLRLTLTPEKGVKEQDLGELELNYTGTTDGKGQNIVLPMKLVVEADDAARDALNAKAEPALKAVREEGILQEAEEAHVAAMKALEEGKKEEAKKMLAESKANLAPAAPSNKAIANKMLALEADEQKLEQAASDMALQKSMVKQSKSSAYQSAKGLKQGMMLQRGDKGFMVEKLQRALTGKGFYTGAVNGIYDAPLEEAVRKFQKSQSIDADGVAGQTTQSALGIQ